MSIFANLLPDPVNYQVLLVGLVVFAGGIVLMFQHLRRWRTIEASSPTDKLKKFEWHKYRRRTLVGALIAGCGAVITSLSNTTDKIMYVTFVTILVLFLVLILALATLDLFSVGLFQFTYVDREKRRAALDEVIRKQKLKQLQEKPPGNSEN